MHSLNLILSCTTNDNFEMIIEKCPWKWGFKKKS